MSRCDKITLRLEGREVNADKESTYWASNPAWYRINKETDEFELTDKAPDRARRSFEMWKANR